MDPGGVIFVRSGGWTEAGGSQEVLLRARDRKTSFVPVETSGKRLRLLRSRIPVTVYWIRGLSFAPAQESNRRLPAILHIARTEGFVMGLGTSIALAMVSIDTDDVLRFLQLQMLPFLLRIANLLPACIRTSLLPMPF